MSPAQKFLQQPRPRGRPRKPIIPQPEPVAPRVEHDDDMVPRIEAFRRLRISETTGWRLEKAGVLPPWDLVIGQRKFWRVRTVRSIGGVLKWPFAPPVITIITG
jgi:hypothetical protein